MVAGPRQWAPISMGGPIAQGELVILSKGWHDGYQVLGLYRATRDLDPTVEEAVFVARRYPAGKSVAADFDFPADFARHVIDQGWLEPVPSHEWNVG